MMPATEQKSQLQKYYLLKKDIELPVKIRLYFLIFQNVLDQTKAHKHIESKKGFSKALLNAFGNLSNIEKGHYLYSNMAFVVEQLDRPEKQKTKCDSFVQQDQIKSVQTTCQMQLTTLKINYWASVSLKLDKIKKIVSITNKKKCFIIQVKNYFVRKSNKYKYSVVMQAITQQINNEGKKYIFAFNHNIIDRVYEQMLKCCLACQHQKLLSLMMEQNQHQEQNGKEEKNSGNGGMLTHHQSGVQRDRERQKALNFLNSNNINNYLNYKEKIQKQILQNKFDFRTLFVQQKLKIQQSIKIQKVFRMQNLYQVDAKELKQKFIYSINHKNKYIIDSQLLQQFSKKYKALYEKLSVNNRVYQYISIREQSVSAQQQILFVKGVQNIMGKNYIQFIQVRVRTISPCQSKLIIYMSIGLSHVITKQVVKFFMLQFHEMLFRKQTINSKKLIKNATKTKSSNTNNKSNQLQEKSSSTEQQNQQNQRVENQNQDQNEIQGQDNDDFMTVKGDSQEYVGYIDEGYEDKDKDEQEAGENQVEGEKKSEKQMKQYNKDQRATNIVNGDHSKIQQTKLTNYLFVKHASGPVKSQNYHKYMTEHYLFKQWVRMKTGGVLCICQQSISNQKKMFRQAVSRLGKSILKGAILQMSFPVVVLKKQSHLQSIARDFCYAPIFFDNLPKQNLALERVKYASLLAISVGTLGISLDKPFNPILGETYQAFIDGCPVYLEQITHHPPVGAYYFQGRGYRIHGQIQPKVNFGLNNVKGFSSRPNFLEFDDGTQIQMVYGKMLIKGLLFGDRQFNFQDKIYAYDKTNHIFSEINYGPKKKAGKKHDPSDFVHGTIYKLKPQFLQKFNAAPSPKIFPTKQYILEQLSKFSGLWHDEIKFDNKVYVNFNKDLPFSLIPQNDPLLSNSSYRTDLRKWIDNNLQQAQKQKDRLQELQRRDRKLREKYKK